jgi:DUF971 family protein
LDVCRRSFYLSRVKPSDIQTIGDELAIKWADGREAFLRLETLRRACPCAGCAGEKDVMGNVYKSAPRPFTAASFQLRRFVPVGSYAIQLFWADGHGTGIYSWEYLQRVADEGTAKTN